MKSYGLYTKSTPFRSIVRHKKCFEVCTQHCQTAVQTNEKGLAKVKDIHKSLDNRTWDKKSLVECRNLARPHPISISISSYQLKSPYFFNRQVSCQFSVKTPSSILSLFTFEKKSQDVLTNFLSKRLLQFC